MIPHGTYSGYKHFGCHCDRCKQAHYRYRKARRLGRAQPLIVDGTGTRRRIHALYFMGWSAAHLAPHLGLTTAAAVSRYSTSNQVYASTAAKVADLYDQLSMTPGPSTKTRQMAQARRLPGPLAWDDDTIDDPAAAPDLGAPEARGPGSANRRLHLEDLEHLLDTAGPFTWEGITARLGVTRGAIEHACSPRRGNRPDLLARIHTHTSTAA